jgi:S1-C subfamily serine protease
MLMASAALCVAEPVAVLPRLQVDFPAASGGKVSESTAVPINGDSLLVAVVVPGADAGNPTLRMGGRLVPVRLVGYDPVSRLGFLKAQDPLAAGSRDWLLDAGGSAAARLQALTPGGAVNCRSNGWVKQVGGKVLPLALLRVNFDQAVPPPGSPLLDSGGRVVGILFQESGSGNTGYAIPAEAVHRVRRDVSNGGRLVRGWLGLTLRAENQSPQIVRVLPGSPAAAAGIRPSDVLLGVGPRRISDYADAANAFFYLIPGQPVVVKVLRGAEPLEFTLTPAKPQAE